MRKDINMWLVKGASREGDFIQWNCVMLEIYEWINLSHLFWWRNELF